MKVSERTTTRFLIIHARMSLAAFALGVGGLAIIAWMALEGNAKVNDGVYPPVVVWMWGSAFALFLAALVIWTAFRIMAGDVNNPIGWKRYDAYMAEQIYRESRIGNG